jgi:glutathione-regulated potassium-efflux system ancillary protein KefG
MARRILVLFAHPMLERSRVNRRLLEAIRDLPGVTVHDLYERYPTMAIDIAAEKALLGEHDAIVLQHPFYWYSAPAIVKEWLDLVLELGWAYGPGGTALRDKIMMNAITTGGGSDAYHRDGYNRFTMRELLAPFDQTAHLCGMKYLAPFVVHGALRLSDEADLEPHVETYRALLVALRDDRLDLKHAASAASLHKFHYKREAHA